MYKTKFLLSLICLFILTSCKTEKKNQSKTWESFVNAIENKNIAYLIQNSSDTIQCVDCFSEDLNEYQSSKFIFKKNLNMFYNSKLLSNKEYSIYENDSILNINYIFLDKYGDTSNNIIYMFNKVNGKFLLSKKITVP